MPRPPCERSRDTGPCSNRSKMRDCISGGKPMPLSRTITDARPRSVTMPSAILPPGLVYFTAFCRRLENTCVRRTRSALTKTSLRSPKNSTLWLRACAAGRTASTAASRISKSGIGSRRSSIKPRLTRATSSRSSTRRVSWLTWRPIVSRCRRKSSSGGRSVRRSKTSEFSNGASGLRNSCASMARNSSLRSCSRRSWSLKPAAAARAASSALTSACARSAARRASRTCASPVAHRYSAFSKAPSSGSCSSNACTAAGCGSPPIRTARTPCRASARTR